MLRVFKALMSAASLLVLMGFQGNAWAADRAAGDDRWSPPWQHGANNDALDRGLEFTVPDADNLADFHGSPSNPLLALYVRQLFLRDGTSRGNLRAHSSRI